MPRRSWGRNESSEVRGLTFPDPLLVLQRGLQPLGSMGVLAFLPSMTAPAVEVLAKPGHRRNGPLTVVPRARPHTPTRKGFSKVERHSTDVRRGLQPQG